MIYCREHDRFWFYTKSSPRCKFWEDDPQWEKYSHPETKRIWMWKKDTDIWFYADSGRQQ